MVREGVQLAREGCACRAEAAAQKATAR